MSNQGSESRESKSRESSPVRQGHARTSCDVCKRMKIKCERQDESCVHCIERGSKCETTFVERKKRQGKRGESLFELETRIKRLESVITASGLDSRPNVILHTANEDADHPYEDPSKLTDRLSTLLIDDEGSSRFLGSASGFSLFSPQGLQWISERTGDNELPQAISRLSNAAKFGWPKSREDWWYPMPPSAREPLPPKHIADQWIQCYFDIFNSVLPLYDRLTFDQYYDLQYSDKPPDHTAWYASFNVVLAMGSMIWDTSLQIGAKKVSDETFRFSQSQHWKYFRNASSCFVDLMFKNPNLMTVQAICGMAILQQMTVEPRSCYVLAAAAARLAYGIGLHRNLDGLSQPEINQRRNVFWIVYIIDKASALRLGHPSVMTDSDIGVDLPEDPSVVYAYPDGSRKFGIFRCQVELARLESRIYMELYSAGSRKRTDLERLRSVGQLDKEVQDWRLTVPIEIRPDEVIRCAHEQFPPVFLMQFAYFNCVNMIHRVSIHHNGSWTSDRRGQIESTLHDQQINPRVYASQSICLAAARSSIKLLQYIEIIDKIDMSRFIWTEMYYPLTSFLTLFANTLQNPTDASMASDLHLMDLVISHITPMIGQVNSSKEPNGTVALAIFEELGKVAKKFVEKINSGWMKKTKRGHDSDEPKQDSGQSATPLPQNMLRNKFTLSSPEYMPAFDELPSQTTDSQQLFQQSLDDFGSQTIGQSSFHADSMTFPSHASNMPLFSEAFEWDLANLWSQEFIQDL